MPCQLEGNLLPIFAAVFCFTIFASLGEETLEEFCQWETLNVTCPRNQFILIISARYGRMKVGRCIPIDYYTGCSVDVQLQLEGRCSGRVQCSIAISDPEMFRVQPCRKDLVPYLEVAYKCVGVSGVQEASSSAICDGALPARSTSGYLASHVTLNTGLGSERCPWLIEARPGQRVIVTLKSFAQKAERADALQAWGPQGATGVECVRVAEVRETIVSSAEVYYFQLCPGNSRRSAAYTSTGNSLQLNFVNSQVAQHRFIIHYEVIGCPDVVAPRNAWLTRNGDTLLVICNYTSERWYIACSGRDWASQLSNCSSVSFTGVYVDNEQIVRHSTSFPFGLLMAVAAGAIIGISIGFGCLLVICIGRRRWKERRHVQNVENANRENVYKLIDLWAKPEMSCECTVLQPEVTCDCVLQDMHHPNLDVGMEALVGYFGADNGSLERPRPENNGRCIQRLVHASVTRSGSRWEGDEPEPRDDETIFYEPGRTLQRCTCTSGKCRHLCAAGPDGSLRDEEGCGDGVEIPGQRTLPISPHPNLPFPEQKTLNAMSSSADSPSTGLTGQPTAK